MKTKSDIPFQGAPWSASSRVLAITLLAGSMLLFAACQPPPPGAVPGPVTNFTATPGDGHVVLEWLNPPDEDLAGVRIQRSPDAFPAAPTEGTMVFEGEGTSHTDTTAENGTTYFYAAFAFNTAGTFSAGAEASATPTPPPVAVPGPVTNLTATPGDGQVVLDWLNPPDADLAGVRIQRSPDAFPASPTEGNMVFEGDGTSHTDTTAENGTKYFYAAFAFNTAGTFSAGAEASATPTSETAREAVLDLYLDLAKRMREVPPAIMPVEIREILIGLLEESEQLYRGGLICDASEALFPLMSELQDLREGDATAFAEDFYNDSRMLRFDMLMSFEEKSGCPGTERLGIETRAEPEEESNLLLTAGGMFSEPIVRTIIVEHDRRGQMIEETFTQVHIPGADSDQGHPGQPAVPIYRTLFAAPRGSDVRLVVEKDGFEVAESIRMNLLPYQEQPEDLSPFDPEFADKPFIMDTATYDQDAPYPPEVATFVSIGTARDMEMYLLEVAAGQYHPRSETLDLFRDARATLHFEGGTGAFITEQSLGAFETTTPLYANAVLNRNVIPKYVEQIIINPEVIGEELLILYHPDFEEEAIRFRNHKRSIGIATNAFPCGTNSGVSGRQTPTQIRSFILNRYMNTLVRLSYVLLLGDAEFIGPFYVNDIGTDWPYSIRGAIGVDKVADFGVGRIPVDTPEQAKAVLDKIIAYEKNPPLSQSFYANATIAAQFQCCRTGSTNPGTAQRTFIQVSEFARGVMMNAGKNVDRIYQRTVDPAYTADPTPRRYYTGAWLPPDLAPGSGFSWNGNTTQIANAWNAGRFLIMHRDHGWHGGWGHPLFNSGHLDLLNNDGLLPVVFSINCASGLFDNETANGAYGTTFHGVYWAEKALRMPNAGAVGIIGDTRNSPSWANSTLTQGFFDAMWPNALPWFGGPTPKLRLGDILNHGKLFLISMTGFEWMGQVIGESSVTNQLYLWHVLGDPTMRIRTAYPYNILLPHSIQFEMAFNGLQVQYELDGTEITVFQRDPRDGSVEPVARGVVEDGEAFLPAVQLNPDFELLFVGSADELVPLELEAQEMQRQPQ